MTPKRPKRPEDLLQIREAAAAVASAAQHIELEIEFHRAERQRIPLAIIAAEPNNGGAGLIISDANPAAELIISDANPAAERLLGPGLVGKRLTEIIPADERDAHVAAVDRRLGGQDGAEAPYLDQVQRRTALSLAGDRVEVMMCPFGVGNAEVGWRFAAVLWPADRQVMADLIRDVSK